MRYHIPIMFKRVPKETKEEILIKVKGGMSVAEAATQYGISTATIYAWIANQVRPEITVLEYNRLKKENEELKRIIGIITLDLERGKKKEIINQSTQKKLIATCMNINYKNIYHTSVKDVKDLMVKEDIEKTFKLHPAYGHRRLALALKMNHKKILRIMHKYNLKPPRLWYAKRFTTESDPAYLASYANLLKTMDLTTLCVGDVWSTDLTYIKFQGKFIYLSIIQDIVGKEVVGFNLSFHHDAELVLKTIKEAALHTGAFPHIFHCDRGRENLAEICTHYLEENNVQVSASDPGSPWQNGWSESFFSRFKQESGNLNRFNSLGELIEYIYGYLKYYNTLRIHTKLKMSPYAFRLEVVESGLEKWGT